MNREKPSPRSQSPIVISPLNRVWMATAVLALTQFQGNAAVDFPLIHAAGGLPYDIAMVPAALTNDTFSCHSGSPGLPAAATDQEFGNRAGVAHNLLSTASGLRIPHLAGSGDTLLLSEVRLAGVPEPTMSVAAALGGVALLVRCRRRS